MKYTTSTQTFYVCNGAEGAQGPPGTPGGYVPVGTNRLVRDSGSSYAPSTIYDDGTKIGIGTANPQAELDVSSGTIAASLLAAGQVNSTRGYFSGVSATHVTTQRLNVTGCFGRVFREPSVTVTSGSIGGYLAANALCPATMRVCTVTEILESINCGAVSSLSPGTTLWVSQGMPSIPNPTNDCNGWTTVESGWNGVVYSYEAAGGAFYAESCGASHAVACCGSGFTTCWGDGDCQPNELCDANGLCAAGTCSCGSVYIPVCGMNGVTYGNSCERACAAQPYSHDGECTLTTCDGGLTCTPILGGEVCLEANGAIPATAPACDPQTGAGCSSGETPVSDGTNCFCVTEC